MVRATAITPEPIAGAAGRYNGLGALAFTTGFLLGPVIGADALGAGRGARLFAVLAAACATAAALRPGRHLPAANHTSPGRRPPGRPPPSAPATTTQSASHRHQAAIVKDQPRGACQTVTA